LLTQDGADGKVSEQKGVCDWRERLLVEGSREAQDASVSN